MADKKALNVFMGEQIKIERNKLGLTREQLAEMVDVTPRFIADVERGSVGISVPTLKKICEVLKVSSDRLIWGETTSAGIDDRLKMVDSDCIEIIDKTVQCQLELIELLKNK